MVPAGLSKFTSRDMKLAKISHTENTSNNKFSKTKISRKWSEAKLESGAKFTIQQFLEYCSPIVSTRPLRKKKKNTNILANWPLKPAPPRGLKSVSKKRKSMDSDIKEQPDPKKTQKMTL